MRHYCVFNGDNTMYIHEKPHWPDFYWNKDEVTPLVDKVRIARCWSRNL